MSEIKHTPGPWEFMRSHSDTCDYEVHGPEGTVAGEYGIREEADARLCAAAPDLLAALKLARQEIVDWNEEIGYDAADLAGDEAMAQIDAAIAKAEGRS